MPGRLGLTGKEAHVLVLGGGPPAQTAPAPPNPASSQLLDIHAGAPETSNMWHFFPQLVKSAIIPTLVGTRFTQADREEWQKGWDDGRRKTPQGYFGDPAAANP